MSSETMTISREEYEEYERLKSQNEQLTRQIEFLTEQIRLARRQRFGSSSEQSRYDDGSEQLSFLFNETEAYTDSTPAIPSEPDLSQVKAHTRKKRITSEEKLPENIEVEVVEKRLSGQELTCPECDPAPERCTRLKVSRSVIGCPPKSSPILMRKTEVDYSP